MTVCIKPKIQYDFEKERTEVEERPRNETEKESVKLPNMIAEPVTEELRPCVEEIIRYDTIKHMFGQWDTLKRVKRMYEEQVIEKMGACFRRVILQQMKERVSDMPNEVRTIWLLKLIRLAFLNKLKDIKYIMNYRRDQLLERLNSKNEEERKEMLGKLANLKKLHSLKELDDVEEIMAMKKAKKEFKMKMARDLEMKIRLRRLKRLEEVREKEMEKLRLERVEMIKDVVTVKKNWQQELVGNIEKITRILVEDMVRLDDKQFWYEKVHSEVEQETRALIEDERERRLNEETAQMIQREKETAKVKRQQKIKEVEAWKNERTIRMWKLEKVKKFEEFLESRFMLAEKDENLFFKKIFDKLTASERKQIEVDPWDMNPRLDERQKEIADRKRLNNWIQGIVSSTRQKVVKKVRLKKYLEVMDSRQLDLLMFHTKRMSTITNVMCVIRGRILRNTFPEKSKNFIATEFNKIVVKTKMDIRDIDPTDRLFSIQVATSTNNLFLATGDNFLIVAEQVIPPPEVPCQGKTDVLCISKEERDKMLELIKKRQKSRKVIKDTRLADYEAYQNRKALDDAWMKYMKKAYEEAVRDLASCRRGDEDVVKIEVQAERPAPRDAALTYETIEIEVPSVNSGMTGLTEEQIKAIVMGHSFLKPTPKKEKLKIDHKKAMDLRVERLVKMVKDSDKKESTKKTKRMYYTKQQTQLKDILQKEKTVRQHMIKNLPPEEEY